MHVRHLTYYSEEFAHLPPLTENPTPKLIHQRLISLYIIYTNWKPTAIQICHHQVEWAQV